MREAFISFRIYYINYVAQYIFCDNNIFEKHLARHNLNIFYHNLSRTRLLNNIRSTPTFKRSPSSFAHQNALRMIFLTPNSPKIHP